MPKTTINVRELVAYLELLAACKAAMPHVYNSPFENAIPVYEMLEAAVAKAEGSGE